MIFIRSLKLLLILFVLLNAVAAMHAYKFTHFSSDRNAKKTEPENLTALDKLKIVFTGVSNPKPLNINVPNAKYQSIILNGRGSIHCWYIKADSAKGTVILFHGYGGEKSGLIEKAALFSKLGYNTLLVDFIGSGLSDGNQVTLGYKEAEDVKTCYEYIKNNDKGKIYLFGTSMGAVAILRAIHLNAVSPNAIIIECPFATMYDAVAIRFKMMHIPTFPMASLLMFWGGFENGFRAYEHNPEEYAKSVGCPTLLMFGEKDDRVARGEIERIYANLNGKKYLLLFKSAGHSNYLEKHRYDWLKGVDRFLCLY